jgi:hypothetical protein
VSLRPAALIILFHVCICWPLLAVAEVYQGIGPLDTLADLRKKWPGANFERVTPAWAQEDDVLFNITGKGLSGLTIVVFTDRNVWARRGAVRAQSDESRELLEKMAQRGEEGITVREVRWVPDGPIPLQRLLSKYGQSPQKGLTDDSFQPFRKWPQGVMAYLSGDEKNVVEIDYSFTPAELALAYQSKFGFVPDEYKKYLPGRNKKK